jgi:hypothetical protein
MNRDPNKQTPSLNKGSSSDNPYANDEKYKGLDPKVFISIILSKC